jgi:hypothetical protein
MGANKKISEGWQSGHCPIRSGELTLRSQNRSGDERKSRHLVLVLKCVSTATWSTA